MSDCILFAGERDARALRRFVQADVPTRETLRALYLDLRQRTVDGVARVPADELDAGEHDPRVLVGMLEQAGLVRRGFDAGRAMTVALVAPPADAAEQLGRLLERSRPPQPTAPTGSSPTPNRGAAASSSWPGTSARPPRRAGRATGARAARAT